MSEHPSETVSQRLISFSQRLPRLPPHLWGELSSIIKEAYKLDAHPGSLVHARDSLAAGAESPADDRADFERECSAMLIDISVDEGGDFRSQVARTLWCFWRIRGRQLQEGFFAEQATECQRLRTIVAEQQTKAVQVDARCLKMIETLTQAKAAQ